MQMNNLQLKNNGFTGALPGAWSNFTTLAGLNLANNNLTGTLPEVWASTDYVSHLCSCTPYA